MTTNDYFDSEMRTLTPDKALDPRAFALCWDTPDPEERRRRDKKLYALATGPKGTGFGIELETFKAVWYACRDAWKEDPVGFIERYVETGSWFSAQALMAEQLPELCYLVEGFLPQGLVLLASPPKYGKSWLALQLCLAVSRGEPFLGMPARQATCLYLALEDGKQRLQKRLTRLAGADAGSRALYFETRASTIADGLLGLPRELCRPPPRLPAGGHRHPAEGAGRKRRLLQRLRGRLRRHRRAEGLCRPDGPVPGAGAPPAQDERRRRPLQPHRGVERHLRRGRRRHRPHPGQAGRTPQTILDLTGRDVEEKRLVLRFDKASCRWQSLGTPAEREQAELAEHYADDLLVQTVLAQLEQRGGSWQTNAKGFIAACEALYGECPVATGYALTKELDRLAPLLKERDGVTIRRASHGSGGRDYCFAGRPAKPALSA